MSQKPWCLNSTLNSFRPLKIYLYNVYTTTSFQKLENVVPPFVVYWIKSKGEICHFKHICVFLKFILYLSSTDYLAMKPPPPTTEGVIEYINHIHRSRMAEKCWGEINNQSGWLVPYTPFWMKHLGQSHLQFPVVLMYTDRRATGNWRWYGLGKTEAVSER